MRKQKVSTYATQIECEHCQQLMSVYSECPPDGFCYTGLLYECTHCHTPYYHKEDDIRFIAPLEEKKREVQCVKCEKPLSETLIKKQVFARCHNCDKENHISPTVIKQQMATEVWLEAYYLYS